VIDPSIGLDAIRDVAIVAGKIAAVDADIMGDAADTIDAPMLPVWPKAPPFGCRTA
jgi:predicted amidohydrolase